MKKELKKELIDLLEKMADVIVDLQDIILENLDSFTKEPLTKKQWKTYYKLKELLSNESIEIVDTKESMILTNEEVAELVEDWIVYHSITDVLSLLNYEDLSMDEVKKEIDNSVVVKLTKRANPELANERINEFLQEMKEERGEK